MKSRPDGWTGQGVEVTADCPMKYCTVRRDLRNARSLMHDAPAGESPHISLAATHHGERQ
jgi:hypothetical protein